MRPCYITFLIMAILFFVGCNPNAKCKFVTLESQYGTGCSRYRVSSWDEICKWLASGCDLHRSDGVCGYECFVNKPECWDVEVLFASSFGGETMFTAEDCLTVYCENMNCDERLPLEGVPSYCRGVYLKGCFDLSKFQFGNEVEYVFLGDTMDVSGCLDFDKMMPNFNGAGNLKCVDWELSSDEYEDVTKVPIWNASRLSGLDQLIDLRIWGGFLIANIDEISRCKSLRNVYPYLFANRP